MSEPPHDPTPMDRLRDIGLLPDLPREELREIVTAAVQEVQERLSKLEEDHQTWLREFHRRPRRRRERP